MFLLQMVNEVKLGISLLTGAGFRHVICVVVNTEIHVLDGVRESSRPSCASNHHSESAGFPAAPSNLDDLSCVSPRDIIGTKQCHFAPIYDPLIRPFHAWGNASSQAFDCPGAAEKLER
jgi:hypothetical protein